MRAGDDPARRQQIGEEVADVLLYLVQLADHTQVDIAAAVQAKLQVNARKHPADPAAGEAQGELPSPQVRNTLHVLLDYENLQPDDEQVRVLVPQVERLWVFHGPHQKQVAERFASFGRHLSIVPISKTGKNALDFHLSFYMGYIAARNPDARFVVLANDKGYEPMLEHARVLGFDVQAIGMARVAKAPARAAATPKPAAKTRARKAPAAKKVAVAKVATKPSPKDQVKPTPAPEPAAPRKTPARKARAASTAKKAAAPATQQAVARKSVRKGAAPAAAAKAEPGNPPTAPLPPRTPRPDDVLLQRIEQGLAKLGAKRPTRLARLRGVLKSYLGNTASEDAVTTALGRLIAASVVDVGLGGEVHYPKLDATRA